ncbi:hypothetical protein HMN09_00365700 [Mycena chlorophos]|uniref:C2H2-type domain-containing protein n=1 Tax=Mycena chlorophos TaxID=658473 RepID=A0A8H6WH83_MYCCL|nr:hypothetical protein HMN09_00365700 [Mycena chlorophos]
MQKAFKKRNIPCLHPGCEMLFESFGGRTKHTNSAHPPQPQTRSPSVNSNPDDPPTSPSSQGMPRMSPPRSPPPNEDNNSNTDSVHIETHPVIDGTPCDRDGFDLEPGTEPEPWDERDPDDYTPFEDRASFAFADFLYTRVQMSGENISQLMQLLAALYPRDDPPFADEKQLYATIDAIPFGNIPWQSFSVQYTGPLPEGEVPTWMTEKYQVWFRSPLSIFEKQLANPDFKDEMDWAAKRIFHDGKRNYTDIFSGNWVWDKSDVLAKEPEYHGALLVPVITGSDKTLRRVPKRIDDLAAHFRQPRLPRLVREFLHGQLYPEVDELPDDLDESMDISRLTFRTYNSARSVFYAPSDICGIGGMRREYIRATKSWFGGPPRYDCALVVHDRDEPGMQGLHAARVRLFFSFKFQEKTYPCALVHWFSLQDDHPDTETGMWIVTPDWTRGHHGQQPALAVVHLDAMLRAAHLTPVFGDDFVPEVGFDASDSLDAFQAFYVSKYADYHAHQTVF